MLNRVSNEGAEKRNVKSNITYLLRKKEHKQLKHIYTAHRCKQNINIIYIAYTNDII